MIKSIGICEFCRCFWRFYLCRNSAIHFIESLQKISYGFILLSPKGSKLSDVICVILGITPFSYEKVLKLFYDSDRICRKLPEPFSDLSIKTLYKHPHPYILGLNILIISIAKKSIPMLLSYSFTLSIKPRQVFLVITSRKCIQRLRQKLRCIPSCHHSVHHV